MKEPAFTSALCRKAIDFPEMRCTQMRKKERALALIDRLKQAYPDADCTLDYNEADRKSVV